VVGFGKIKVTVKVRETLANRPNVSDLGADHRTRRSLPVPRLLLAAVIPGEDGLGGLRPSATTNGMTAMWRDQSNDRHARQLYMQENLSR
jgi:hypothetical protein